MERASSNRRHVLFGGIALSALSFFTPGCTPDGQRILRGADTHPDGYPTVMGVQEMGRLLSERTGGRLQLKIYTGGQLGEEKDTLEITVFGGLDFNRVNLAPLNAIAIETVVPTLPFLFRDEPHMRAAMDGAPGDAILKALEPHGLVGLCYYDSGARSFYTTQRAIHTPSDLKGQKIRVQNSDLFVSMVETLGGDATPMSFGEVYQGLLQGIIDGAENNWPSYESTRHFEAAKYYSLTRHVMAPEVLLVSLKRWRTFSGDDQALIRRCARDSVPVMRKIWDERSTLAKSRLIEAGVEIIQPDQQAFINKVRPVWDKFLTSPALKKLADDIQAVSA